MAGAGYKLFSTGDVLSASDVNTYLMQQTVMSFASSAARTTALASVLAEGMVTYLQDTNVVEIYTGAAWVSLDDPNAIQNSLLTAKGSIVTATGASTPSALAVGTANQVLTVDSSTATGLKWATPSSSSGPTLVDYTPTFTNFTLGNGTAITKWYDASSTMFYIYVNITYGSTSTQSGALRVSTPATTAGDADAAVAGQMVIAKFCDVSAGKDYQCYAAAGTNTSLQLFSYDVTTSPARNGAVNDTTPVVPATGDELFIQGWLRKA